MRTENIHAFPVALPLEDRAVLVVGGGDEAVLKVPKLLAAGARVAIVAPDLPPALRERVDRGEVTWRARDFEADDVRGMKLVMLTELDAERGRALRELADREHFWLCTLDQPAFTDFYMVSTLERGPIQISVGSSGKAPLLARRVREALDRALGPEFGTFARRFAELRARLRPLPRQERSEILERALDGFAMDVRLSYPEADGQGAGDPPKDARDR